MVLRRWKRIGRDVHLGAGRPWIKVTLAGRVVLVRVMLWRYAARLPSTTAHTAAPNWRAVCGWQNIGPWRDWRWSAIRVSPNRRRRNWCAGIVRGGRWAWNDDDPKWCSGRRRRLFHIGAVRPPEADSLDRQRSR